jgi:alpha-mannosidase
MVVLVACTTSHHTLLQPEHNTFWWRGLDGSVVLAHFPPADDYNAQATVSDVMKTATNNKDKGRTGASIMLFGNGDGGGGPNLPMFEQLARMGASCGVEQRAFPDTCIPRVQLSSPRIFFEALTAEIARHDVTTWQGELFLELHQGSWSH